MAANSGGSAAKKQRGRPFQKGQSGNPSGRPKTSSEQKSALEAIRNLAPEAVETMQQMLRSPDTPPAVKARLIGDILDRTFGKAMLPVSVDDPQNGIMDDIRAEVERIRAKVVSGD